MTEFRKWGWYVQDGTEIVLSVAEGMPQRNCTSSTVDTRNSPISALHEEKLHQQLKVLLSSVLRVAALVMLQDSYS